MAKSNRTKATGFKVSGFQGCNEDLEPRSNGNGAPLGHSFEELAVSLKRYPDAKPAPLTERDRLVGFYGNCVLGARWRGLAQRGESPGLSGPVGPTENCRQDIQCRDGQTRRQRVRSNLPSGLLMVRRKLGRSGAASTAISILDSTTMDESPRGDVWLARPGEVTAFSSTYGGMIPVKGKDAKSPQL